MKALRTIVGLIVLACVAAGGWIVMFHSDWFKPHLSEEGEKEVVTDVPVRAAVVTRATLRHYVEGYGAIEPEPAMGGKPAAGAVISSPVAGLVAQVLCETGQKVASGAVLFQLDERLAKAQEEQWAAALESAKATLARVKATPRPEQLEVAQLLVEKARVAAELARANFERMQKLPADVTSPKNLQIAEAELSAARSDLKAAEKQYALLKASPTPEELAEAVAKVAEADRALAVAKAQREMLKITSPLDATVVRVNVNRGEVVDATKIMAEVTALDRLVVNVTVSARELGALKEGQVAEVRVDDAKAAKHSGTTQPTTEPSESPAINGKVRMIGYQVDRKSDTVPVWIGLPADAGLRPGQYARVRIIVEEHADRLAVPVESVVKDEEGNPIVAVIKGDKAFHKSVRTGLHDRNLVEIEATDLKEGDEVVTEGAYGLPKETKVHIIGR